jgi:diaminohydroxyphosphoribosylaminopyrimidine deaminase / 5-amino-6-(5-phosphoribosylamino)uracil reductase
MPWNLSMHCSELIMKKPPLQSDEYWMQVALELAAEGEGMTRPNPPVGALVVKNGKIVGLGFHPKAGQPHAEIFALAEAGRLAKGATLYVTLEPCCTQGRTPPCTEAIIKSGVKRVVFGCVDPNPVHAGRAEDILRNAGISVTRGVLEESCSTMIRPFASRLLLNRPFVTLKLACSLDGKIADFTGTSKWITGEQSREAVQELRRSVDGIMVGAETLRLDNPSLLPRPAFGREPWRIIIAGNKPLSLKSNVFTDAAREKTIVYAPKGFKQHRQLNKAGIRVVVGSSKKHVALKPVLRDLAKLGCLHIVCEGGGVLAESLLKAKLADQVWMFYAPIILGGGARPAVAGKGWSLGKAPGFTIKHVEKLGRDVLIVAEK